MHQLDIAPSHHDPGSVSSDVLAIGVYADGGLAGGGTSVAAASVDTLTEGDIDLADLLRIRQFTGTPGQALWAPGSTAIGHAATVLLVGLGAPDTLTLDTLRQAAAVVVTQAAGATSVATTIAQALPDPLAAARAVSEAATLAAYRFDRFKTKRDAPDAPRLTRLDLLLHPDTDPAAAQRAITIGRVRGQATNLARDLVNTPANHLHPADLAAAAQDAVKGHDVSVRILDEQELRDGGFGGILGVGQGAQHPPRLVELVYEPEQAVGSVVLVGKGITFDSGGLSIKTRTGMADQKADMAGAAAVTAVMTALADLDIRLQVTGYLACAENLPSGTATRPGDVLQFRNGTTVEVLNTDAEGRLVLGDALALAAESAPDAIVDVATLTGACVVALGPKLTGLMSNNQPLAEELLTAAGAAGEPTWQLPLPAVYRTGLDSHIADLKNVTKPGHPDAAALYAGLFLQEFVAGRPWAHLDIAGPATTDGDQPTGATGTAVRTLLSWLESRNHQPAAPITG